MSSKEIPLAVIWSANSEALNYLSTSEVFNRAALVEFKTMVQAAQSGQILANDVIEYINPRNRRSPPFSVTAFGLGYVLDQGLRPMEKLAGYNRQIAIVYERSVHQAYDDILNASGLADTHILKKNSSGVLEPIPYTKAFGNKDVIQRYISSFNQCLDYFETLFSPDDVITSCQRNITRCNSFISLEINPRTGKPISSEEKNRERLRIEGYQQAITRNLARKKQLSSG